MSISKMIRDCIKMTFERFEKCGWKSLLGLFFLQITLLLVQTLLENHLHSTLYLTITIIFFFINFSYLIWYFFAYKSSKVNSAKPIHIYYEIFFAFQTIFFIGLILEVLIRLCVTETALTVITSALLVFVSLRLIYRLLIGMISWQILVLIFSITLLLLFVLGNINPSTWPVIPLLSAIFLFLSSDEGIILVREKEADSNTKEYYDIKRKLVHYKAIIIPLPLFMFLSLVFTFCEQCNYAAYDCALFFRKPWFSHLCGLHLGLIESGILRFATTFTMLIVALIALVLCRPLMKYTSLHKEIQEIPNKKYPQGNNIASRYNKGRETLRRNR